MLRYNKKGGEVFVWAVIILLMLCVLAGGFIFLVTRVKRFEFISNFTKSNSAANLLSAGLLLAVYLVFTLLLGFVNATVIYLHLTLIWALCDLFSFLIGKIMGKSFKRYIAGWAALIITTAYLLTGVFFNFYVFKTEYTVKTEKPLPAGDIKVVGFSDSHIGKILSPERLKKYIKKINAEKPDIVVIVGDFADDSTTKSDMINACKALNGLKAKYGCFYVFGNHDAGYYSQRRGYGKKELVKNLEKNGVTVLSDQTASVGGINLIGRLDRQDSSRMAIGDFPAVNGFTLVLDHQPNDYENEAAAQVDLVISGHTHGGQLIPVNTVGELIGANDFTYGRTKIKNTEFLVTSGIAGWELYFKTGCISEYFVVNIKNK